MLRTRMHAHNSISSSVQYSYSCHYFSPCCRRFWPCFLFLSFMLAACSPLPLPITLRFFYLFPRFRVGPSIAVSRSNGPSFALFFLPLSFHTSYPTCMTSFFILCYKPSFPSPVNTTPILVRSPLLRLVFALVLPWLLRFPVCNCHHLALCIKTPAPPVILSHLSSPFSLVVPF